MDVMSAKTTSGEGIRQPYLIFLGDVASASFAKTAFGVRDWLPDQVVGQQRLPGCTIDANLPDMDAASAVAAGARSLLIGVAPGGGRLPAHWIAPLEAALQAGLDIVSGLHDRLAGNSTLVAAAERHGRRLHDVRHSDREFPIGTGRKRSGKRLLTVGTDCALGKKYTALALAHALQARGIDADFRATGQTGIMIAGAGVAIDAVVADFIAGAAETLSPDAAPDHWDIIEGQGSIFHPAYAGVTLGLIHGSQADALVLCHDPSRRHINMYPDYAVPTLERAVALHLDLARLTNPRTVFVGLSLNTSTLPLEAAQRIAAEAGQRLGLPCFDPLRFGIEAVGDRLLEQC